MNEELKPIEEIKSVNERGRELINQISDKYNNLPRMIEIGGETFPYHMGIRGGETEQLTNDIKSGMEEFGITVKVGVEYKIIAEKKEGEITEDDIAIIEKYDDLLSQLSQYLQKKDWTEKQIGQ